MTKDLRGKRVLGGDAPQVHDAVQRAERELGRLDVAVVVAPDAGAGLALDALRKALAGRAVVVLAVEREAAEAIRDVASRLYD